MRLGSRVFAWVQLAAQGRVTLDDLEALIHSGVPPYNRGMKMFAMCRNCGRSLGGPHGLCRLCALRQIPRRRVQKQPAAKKLR